MDTTSEVIDEPLTYDALGEMYCKLCDDPLFANVPGKIELDVWGRILMSPATPYHGKLQARLARSLSALGGEAYTGPPIVTPAGLLVPDVAWASAQFVSRQDEEMPFTRAPELCIEVASPSNSRNALSEKIAAYLAAGAVEAWIVLSRSKRFEFYGKNGPLPQTAFEVDLSELFD
ncbi:MAG: Uma2 family endonuclease [Burkholderiales bacterium]